MTNKNSRNVDSWIKNRTDHQVKALENASRIFDDNDALTVNTIEAIYARESSFGNKDILKNDKKGEVGASGHFQIERKTAETYSKKKITKTDDLRHDVDDASNIAALYLADINQLFAGNRTLLRDPETKKPILFTFKVENIDERKLFVIAAYNAGQGQIAKAQMAAEKDGKDATRWEIVKEYLKEAGATDAKVKEIIEYVESIIAYEKEFSSKSKANKKLKDKEPKKVLYNNSEDGHWVTLDNGNHVFIGNKKVG